ncbi:MAG: hypothetical protein AAB654_09160 [Acidobacteriota bacterium]
MPGTPASRCIRQTLREAAWAPLLVLCAVVVIDKIFDAFARFPWFDVPVHFLGGIDVTCLFRCAAANADARLVAGLLPDIRQEFIAFGRILISNQGRIGVARGLSIVNDDALPMKHLTPRWAGAASEAAHAEKRAPMSPRALIELPARNCCRFDAPAIAGMIPDG